MMPVKGEIHVNVTGRDAGTCARWLRNVYLPSLAVRPDTILTPGFGGETMRLLGELATILSRSAARKRPCGGSYTINLPRQMVERFAVISYGVASRWPAPAAVDRVMIAMKEAACSGRGRPRLIVAQRAERLTPDFLMVQDRQKKRLKRQNRIDGMWSDWFDEITERGETVLTARVPSPKI